VDEVSLHAVFLGDFPDDVVVRLPADVLRLSAEGESPSQCRDDGYGDFYGSHEAS